MREFSLDNADSRRSRHQAAQVLADRIFQVADGIVKRNVRRNYAPSQSPVAKNPECTAALGVWSNKQIT